MASALSVHALEKVFRNGFSRREIRALSGIDFEVAPGEVFGLLGPNGAGKTTTVKILLGLTFPTKGEARILGLSARSPESRRRTGYLPEGHRFPGYLTARQTLSIFGRMAGLSRGEVEQRIPALLSRVRLPEWADVKVKKFSKGMTQRLGLAAALIHQPEVLLLDEPTDGVDPVGRREIRDLLREEAARGTAILLNSHLLSEIELTCDRVTVLRKGSVAATGTIKDLTGASALGVSSQVRYRMVAYGMTPSLVGGIQQLDASIAQTNGHFELSVRDYAHLNQVIDRLRAEGAELRELTPLRSSLEDVFVELVKTGDLDSPEVKPS
ncbi:MAG: ABC transporter ATP-binding protein [Thermoanaerobaculia bacterium]|nr:ABC transporter ATP-binding protein [Thermoanaerobaculia bacterium]